VSPVNRNGTRRVRTSGGGSSTAEKPAASAASDWYIATGSSAELLEQTIKPLIETFLGKRGLKLSAEKTCITQSEDGFDFLGHRIRKYKRGSRYQLLSTPSPKNIQTFLNEERLGVKMAEDLRGRRRLLHWWKAQDGLCPVCNQKITFLTGWHNHHIVWRSLGGSDRTENRMLLHPNCHRQVHSHGLSVVKPCPEKGV
jgi:HNH endonuclease